MKLLKTQKRQLKGQKN